MLSVNPIGNSLAFKGYHAGTRKLLSSESQKLLDKGIQEINSAYSEVKNIRHGKSALELGDTLTLRAKSPDGSTVELQIKDKPYMKYNLRAMKTLYTESEQDLRNWSYIEFDQAYATEKVNFREVTPLDVYKIQDYRKMDENPSILASAEKFIKQYMPLFVPEK